MEGETKIARGGEVLYCIGRNVKGSAVWGGCGSLESGCYIAA